MREHIIRRLSGSGLPQDPAAEARDGISQATLDAWFSMPLRPAAVLIPLLEQNSSISMMLTERTHDLPEHPGQIAFPGGRSEPGDADLLATALREAYEEVGLPPTAVEPAGYLKTQAVITGYAVVPVIGFVTEAFDVRPDPREVASIFEVPLDFLLDEANCVREDREIDGITLATWEYQWQEHRIWGATAKIIQEFIKQIK
ncbi:MAG: CoA pyrophosphatase [Chromatiales bacterium]|nr:CoA pyrophosphatase [Chromatiales bacterium]MDP6150657.1 CoA pyrophosphatase [Gammaproteobacteria bacterium]MDP7269949.1 CoA pyrophosphatase [Gammaproteobacteria bacterium]HJP05503.1 CoA pyrophosphatase [Gammaproteobacteria bacterium]